MDPLSIASAAIAISVTVARVLYGIGSFVAAAKGVDENLQGLHAELSTLHGSISSIASSFQVPAFAAAAKAVSDEYRNSIWTHFAVQPRELRNYTFAFGIDPSRHSRGEQAELRRKGDSTMAAG